MVTPSASANGTDHVTTAPVEDRFHHLSSFESAVSFPLDPFQIEAIRHLLDGRSVLVAAPTSSGKTIVAEFAVHRALREGRGVVYTSPLKALSNQKFGDFCRVWGHERVGLLTGDVAVNAGARVRVMTTEVLRNMLLQSPEGLGDVQTVVLDEFHYLGDAERGRVWEEIVILLPREIQLIALSATISNAEQMRAWVSRAHAETALVASDDRPVPLEIFYYHQDRLHRAVDASGRQVARLRAGGEARLRRRPADPQARARAHQDMAHQVTSAEVVSALASRDMLPAITFLFSRARTEREADKCAAAVDLVVTPEQRDRIEVAINETLAFMSEEHRALPQVGAMMRLLRRGIAFHHAGLLPGLKVLVETLFADGVVGVVFATETLALGINMPARAVVVPHLTKFDGTVRRPLASREFHQLIGRAGRRGMDAEGYAILVHDEWMSFDEAMGIVRRPLEPILSSFQLGYNSLVNLLLTYKDRDVLGWLMDQSLLAHQMAGRRRTLMAERARLDRSARGEQPGCLIGGPDTLGEYERLLDRVESGRAHVETLESERRGAAKRRVPGPQEDEVRRWVRQARGGELLYIEDAGWSVLVPQHGSPIVIPLEGLAETGRRRRMSLHLDKVEAVVPADDDSSRLDLDTLPHLTQRGSQPLPASEREALRRQIEALPFPVEGASPAEARRREHLRQLDQRLDAARAELRSLEGQAAGHRCAGCEVLQEHRRLTRRTTSSSRLVANLDQEIAQLAVAQERDLRDVIVDMMAVLETFGYVREGACDLKAEVLARIVDPNTLILTELAMGDFLARLPYVDLAEVISWFAEADADGQYARLKGSLRTYWDVVRELSERIMDLENRRGLYHSRGPSPAHPGLVRAWCKETPFGELMASFEMAEGDGIRYLKKTGDLLRQVRRALEETGLRAELCERVRAAEDAVRRDIVVSQELLELSEVIDVAESDLPAEIQHELEEVTHDAGAVHPPTPEHHVLDLHAVEPERPVEPASTA